VAASLAIPNIVLVILETVYIHSLSSLRHSVK